jgi:hypothetical protein
MLRYMNTFAAFVASIGSLFVCVQTSSARQNPVTAIDIALEPDGVTVILIEPTAQLIHSARN